MSAPSARSHENGKGGAREKLRSAVSWFLCVFQCYLAVLYLFPQWVGQTRPGNPTWRIVLFIQNLGPYYSIAFGVSGAVLLITLIARRRIYIGHTLCFGVLLAYAMSLLIGTLGVTPHGPVLAPSLCLVPIMTHAVLAFVYSGEGP